MNTFFEVVKTMFKSLVSRVDDTSPVGETDVVDWAKILREAGLLGASAVLSYLVGYFTNTHGVFELVLVPVFKVALDYVQKLLKDNS